MSFGEKFRDIASKFTGGEKEPKEKFRDGQEVKTKDGRTGTARGYIEGRVLVSFAENMHEKIPEDELEAVEAEAGAEGKEEGPGVGDKVGLVIEGVIVKDVVIESFDEAKKSVTVKMPDAEESLSMPSDVFGLAYRQAKNREKSKK